MSTKRGSPLFAKNCDFGRDLTLQEHYDYSPAIIDQLSLYQISWPLPLPLEGYPHWVYSPPRQLEMLAV